MAEQDYRNLVVNLALRYKGCSNGDKLQKRLVDIYNLYLPHPRGYAPKYTDSWCAIFVSANAIMANLTSIIPIECGCGEMVNLAKQKGIWKGMTTPAQGDIIMYDNKKDGWADHTGFVVSVNGNTITTIEGNANGGQCVEKTVQLTDANILGFIRPDYASIAGPAPAPATGFPWYGIVQTEVNLRTSPQNLGPLNWCNIESPTGSKVRHTLKAGEKVKIIGESGNWWQTEITGPYTWTPFIAKTSGGKDIVKRI